jgi:sugar lactone lactonase YvrE
VGSSAAGWRAPDGLVVDGNAFYLADEAASQVWFWQPGESPRALLPGNSQVSSPEDIIRDMAGNLYFTDDDAGGVWRLTSAGDLHRLAGAEQGLAATEGLAILGNGDLLVGDGQAHKLFRIARDGGISEVALPITIRKAESMASDEQGNIYIADDQEHRVYRLSANGNLTTLLSPRDGLQTCESLCYVEGALYLTDDQAAKLYRWTAADGLRTIAQFSGRLRNVQGVAAGPDGEVYVTIQASLKRGEGYLVRLRRVRGS